MHAIFSDEPGRQIRSRYFSERGWIPHVHPIETVRTCRGIERLANSDNLILLTAGWLASRTDADLILLASGDGTLVCDIARFLAEAPRGRAVASLSLAGSTSMRLDAENNQFLVANLEIGRDVVRPLHPLGGDGGRSTRPWVCSSERVTRPRAQAY